MCCKDIISFKNHLTVPLTSYSTYQVLDIPEAAIIELSDLKTQRGDRSVEDDQGNNSEYLDKRSNLLFIGFILQEIVN